MIDFRIYWAAFAASVVLLACTESRTPVSATVIQDSKPAETPKPSRQEEMKVPKVKVQVFTDKAVLSGPIEMPKVVKSDAEWKVMLTPEQFAIARSKGTERPFCGTLLDNKMEGVYACICCRLPLFSSAAKFNSGTGWPSFFQTICPENVREERDVSHGMVRTEILCARCDAHLGHVFEDGPRPTGLRYCLNSESLFFTKSDLLATLAETPKTTTRPAGKTAEIVLGGGCFWCVEAVFEELGGIFGAVSGYAGGRPETANYKAVCRGDTGHAEVVKLSYDPSKLSLEQILEVFFATHDPTTLNRQGADVGTQYRSSIFFANKEQEQVARAMIDRLNREKVFPSTIVTTLEPLETFYPAEEYHQGYVCANPEQGYVRAVALPKVKKVREKFGPILKEKSPLELGEK